MKKSVGLGVFFVGVLILIGFIKLVNAGFGVRPAIQNFPEPVESVNIEWYIPGESGMLVGELKLIGPIRGSTEQVRNVYEFDGITLGSTLTLIYNREIDRGGGEYILKNVNPNTGTEIAVGFKLFFNFYNSSSEDGKCKDSDGKENFNEKGFVIFVYPNGTSNIFEDYCGYSSGGAGPGAIDYWCDGNQYYSSLKDCECKNGTCITSESITEQITCFFINSKEIQKCYSADEGGSRFYCSGVDSCVVDVKSYQGEKVTWKSSCGGYDYSIVDGINNNVDFNCSSGEIGEEEIKNMSFRYAYWKCYDSLEEKQGDATSCKPSELWKKYAQEFCEGHCYKDGSKCGVNSFGVTQECYLDEFEELGPEVVGTIEKPEPEFTEEVLVCKNSCSFDEKCYPFGYRKKENYCSDEGKFIEQKTGDSACENNFECDSNVCVSGECISEGLLKKILNWFKKLF